MYISLLYDVIYCDYVPSSLTFVILLVFLPRAYVICCACVRISLSVTFLIFLLCLPCAYVICYNYVSFSLTFIFFFIFILVYIYLCVRVFVVVIKLAKCTCVCVRCEYSLNYVSCFPCVSNCWYIYVSGVCVLSCACPVSAV